MCVAISAILNCVAWKAAMAGRTACALDVLDGQIQRSLGDAHAVGGHISPRVVEELHELDEAVALRAEEFSAGTRTLLK